MRRKIGFGRAVTGTVVAVVSGVLLFSGTAGAAPSAAAQLFRNCDEARAAGFTDMRSGEPGYTAELDRDSDGIACEASDAAPAAPAVPDPVPQPAPQAAMPEVQAATQDSLAQTGVSTLTPLLLVAALVLMFMGRRLQDAGYERLDWITGRRRAEVRYTVEPAGRRRR